MSVRVCLSVCPSYPGILQYQQTFLTVPSGSHTTLVSPYQTVWQDSYSDPLTETLNAGVWKIRDFWPIFRFILEMIQDSAIFTM